MTYYLKKTTLKGRTYLSIDTSYYDNEKKRTAHKVYKSLGSIETLKKNGMENPVAYYQQEVDRLNKELESNTSNKISDKSLFKHLGYFPLKSIMDKLDVKKYVDVFQLINNDQYDLYELITSLIYARAVCPCSKYKTFHDVLPCLYDDINFSYDQLLKGLSYIGNDYEKFVALFTKQVRKEFGLDSSKTYFDCTNFYFEIDKEDDFRRKGPSKENRKMPIVGLGLLLDRDQIPIAMKMYPGNQSEKPILRNVIDKLKTEHNIIGKTIHVADKGLNCAQNIEFSKKNGDGYLFSKSVKTLPDKEKVWILLENDYVDVKDSSGKVVYSYKSCIDQFPYTVEFNGKTTTIMLTEKRLVTYNPSLAIKKRYEINRMVEKAKALIFSQANKADCGESGKYVNFIDNDGKKAKITINQDAIDDDLRFAGYDLLVTSELNMTEIDMYNTYHSLWHIEESFKIMKSDLDARPVYLQKEETIKGHFLICYLTVLLERLLQFKVLKNKYSTNDIIDFIRDFKAVKVYNEYLNVSTKTTFIEELEELTKLPLTNLQLSINQIKEIFRYRFK